MISSKRPIVVYIEQARIPDETTSITRSEVPITGDIVVHHRIQNGANNKAMGDGFLKELYDVLNGAVGENLRFEDGASVFVYTSCARSIENYENFERNIQFGSDLPVHSFRACQKIFNLCKENHYDLHMQMKNWKRNRRKNLKRKIPRKKLLSLKWLLSPTKAAMSFWVSAV